MKRWLRYAFMTVLIVMGCVGGLAATAYTLSSDPSRIEAARRDLERSLGGRITIAGSIDVFTLPRPRILARGVAIAASDGAVVLEVNEVRASLAWLPLLQGRLAIGKLQFVEPTGVVDLEALGRRRLEQVTGLVSPGPSNDDLVPDRITITSGVVQLRSKTAGLDGMLTDLHANIDGLDGAGVTIAGGAGWHGGHGDVSAHFDSTAALLGGTATEGSVKLRSPLLTVAMIGTFARGWQGGFSGKVALSSPAFPRLMRVAGLRAGADFAIQHASLAGDAETTSSGIALANAKLVLNDTALEGTLAWQGSQDHPGLVGTLATDTLALDPMISALPPLRNPDGIWNSEPLDAALLRAYDVDLRVSANRVTLNGVVTEDAALSVLCQAGRLELSLGEAKAYGGLLKGRIFANDVGDDVEVKVDATWSRLDLDEMTALFGTSQGQLAGYATGHFTAGGRGDTVSAIMNSALGRGQISLRQARLVGIPIVDALIRPDAAPGATQDGTERPIDLAAADFRMVDGVVTIGEASVAGPDLHLGIQGETSLPLQDYRLWSTSSAPGAGSGGAGASAAMLTGRWGGPMRRLEPDTVRAIPVPAGADDEPSAFFP